MKALIATATLMVATGAFADVYTTGAYGQAMLDDGYGNQAWINTRLLQSTDLSGNYQTSGGMTLQSYAFVDGQWMRREVILEQVSNVRFDGYTVRANGYGTMSLTSADGAIYISRGDVTVSIIDSGYSGSWSGRDEVSIRFMSDEDSFSATGYAVNGDLSVVETTRRYW